MAPSAKNPNAPSRAKLAAKATKNRAQQQRQSADGHKSRIEKQDKRRGARAGLLPTSGPNKAISRKKARKMERALGHALRRQEEAEAAEAAEAEDDETADQEMLAEEDDDGAKNGVAAESSANKATTSKKGKAKTRAKGRGTAEATREVEMDDIA